MKANLNTKKNREACCTWYRARVRAGLVGALRQNEIEAAGFTVDELLKALKEAGQLEGRESSVGVQKEAFAAMLKGDTHMCVCPVCRENTLSIHNKVVLCKCGVTLPLSSTVLSSETLCENIKWAHLAHEASCTEEPIYRTSCLPMPPLPRADERILQQMQNIDSESTQGVTDVRALLNNPNEALADTLATGEERFLVMSCNTCDACRVVI
eukprot:TRINITY_DN15632_c0_g1_i1.p1 TRINITY_DN15632_c0_g1~~TRINITY_DN15632_c0_g1_i1.p1  ORF type:complete len:211 (+),score=26.41 TRINITY_DN15632_c0_g1_i1:37-669(+)